ncbi:MAG: ribbon-helix-helix protein, CopG family [Leptolyngbya sp. UWPOB_LEPTO1]|uniref:ribbon-helix-helix protein, CopG family n=1 Tax=Leptolyngbya sp. UWPOB_LEPTO1 TaxID=2815653 RepID=UPI001AC039DA|nr:ribbon-helix-helix protein, CopG family [Leptolyngbya sp. UWPOB_LEPTO1]MBN8564526.1 ribbon-helix-helix protein, CopG family [Leptolyngbya sp. UWPOB_LEPTO1]
MPSGTQKQNIGFRVEPELFAQLEALIEKTGRSQTELMTEALISYLGLPETLNMQVRRLNDRVSALEARINHDCPSENGQEDGSGNIPVQSDVANPPYLLSEWVNADALIICPHCSSLDSDWADEDESAQVRSILCHGCGKTSRFDLAA